MTANDQNGNGARAQVFALTMGFCRPRLIATLSVLVFAILGSTSVFAREKQCHETSKYFVIERPSGGTDFLIKYKPTADATFACKYQVEPGDLEIKNQWAEYFLGLSGDLLILDSGTGNHGRRLILWNLAKRKKVLNAPYEDPIEIKSTSMTYWLETGKANARNCPKYVNPEDEEMSIGAVIETKVTMLLADFNIARSSQTRCAYRE